MRWSDLSGKQQALALSAGVAEAILTSIALIDIARRPTRQIRGGKLRWVLASVVQPLGPLAYLSFGRLKSA